MSDLQLILRQNYRQFATGNLVLNGIPATNTTEAVNFETYWRWEDETDMEPLYLGRGKVGESLIVPFDTNGREIRLFTRSQTENGQYSTNDIKQATQTTFKVGGCALLSALTFSSGATHGTVANNGGTGTIRIFRRVGANDFAEVTSISSTTTTFDDTPPINGTYDYQLSQDGQDGVSNTKTITATGLGSPTGSAPDTLAGTHDGVETVGLTWVNHSGTGLNYIERKLGSDPWAIIDSVASGTAAYNDTVPLDSHSHVYYYRVSNGSVAGYSNTLAVYVTAA